MNHFKTISMQLILRSVAFFILLTFHLFFLAGCNENSDSKKSTIKKNNANSNSTKITKENTERINTPVEVVEKMHELRVQKKYRELEKYMMQTQRIKNIKLIYIMDDLILARDRLFRSVLKKFGTLNAQVFEQKFMDYLSGIFSKEVFVRDKEINESQATITYQTGDILPLETIKLKAVDGFWYPDLGEPDDEFLKELQNLVDAISSVADQLNKDELSIEKTIEIYTFRTSRILDRIAKISQESSANQND